MEEDLVIHVRVPGAFILNPRVLNPHRNEFLEGRRVENRK
jgi:hypothetical protein